MVVIQPFTTEIIHIHSASCNNVAPTDFGSWSELQSDAILANSIAL